MKKKILATLILATALMLPGCTTANGGSEVTTLPVQEDTRESVDIFDNPLQAEGQTYEGEGKIEEDPLVGSENSAIVFVTTNDGKRLALVLGDDALNYHAGDVVKISGEVAGTTTADDGSLVPMIDGAEITPVEN